MTTREPRIPGPDHPITIEKAGVRVLARVGTHVVADTTRALTLREADYPAVQYIPLDDVDQALLAPSQTQTYCPYKGDASYYTITLPEGTLPEGTLPEGTLPEGTLPEGTLPEGGLPEGGLPDAVWTYREPYDSVAPIANHVAFYTDRVEVVTEPA